MSRRDRNARYYQRSAKGKKVAPFEYDGTDLDWLEQMAWLEKRKDDDPDPHDPRDVADAVRVAVDMLKKSQMRLSGAVPFKGKLPS